MTDQQHTPDTAPSSVPAVVGVLGGGRMGGGIAHAFLVSGSSEVVVVERDPQSAEAAEERAQEPETDNTATPIHPVEGEPT